MSSQRLQGCNTLKIFFKENKHAYRQKLEKYYDQTW